MSLFSSMKISQRIRALVIGLFLGFVAIACAYYWQTTIERDIRKERKWAAESQTLLSEVRMQATVLNRLLLEALAFGSDDLLDELKRSKAALFKNLEQLKSIDESSIIHTDLSSIEKNVEEFALLFSSSQALLKETQSANEGLIQMLEKSGDELSEVMAEQGIFNGQQKFLRLRIHERIYITTNGAEVLSPLESGLDELAETYANSSFQAALSDYRIYLQRLGEVFHQLQAAEQRLRGMSETLLANVADMSEKMAAYSLKVDQQTEAKSRIISLVFLSLLILVALGVGLSVYFIYKSTVFPLAHIQGVIRLVNQGNMKARVELESEDELGDLAKAFNLLLDERINTLEEQAIESEKINQSILALIHALKEIANKNLTVKVPVSQDITASVSDAVNMLTEETALTLAQVKTISQQVHEISDRLQTQSSIVVRVAEDERKQVMATSRALELSAQAVNEIASRAGTADSIATKTISDTKAARDAVTKTVKGILSIRESIFETEKRLKRLGERSQEITGIVNLINTISERTHILALNASMHAASAGEAGKGFAVVADEVQRLAENAREATSEIASMVHNIRVETADTVNTMNNLISEVAMGTQLAEQANKKMQITEEATRQLVETVQVISHSSIQQAQISNNIRDRANTIRKFTEKSGNLLVQQKRHTDNLKHFAGELMDSVNVFVLPDGESASFEFTEVPLVLDETDQEPA